MRTRPPKDKDPLAVEQGRRLREARLNAGIDTQDELATLAGMSQGAVGNFESGARAMTLQSAKAFEEVLGWPYAYFLGAIDKETARELASRLRVEAVRAKRRVKDA